MEFPALVLLLDFPEGDWMPAGLRRDFGEKFAPRIVRLMAELQLSRFPREWDAEIHVAPGERIPDVRAWLGSKPIAVHAQLSAPFGERLAQVAAETLARHGRPVLLLRADCPYCDVEKIAEAVRALWDKDMVFGPATDGDFYLLGMKRLPAGFFDEIHWGTNQVLFMLAGRARDAGQSVAMLDPLERVKDERTWNRAVERLFPSPPPAAGPA